MKTFFSMAIAGLAAASPVPYIYQNSSSEWTALNIKEDGKDKTVYIAAPSYFKGEGGDHLKVPMNGRALLSNSPTLNPDKYYKPMLLGGSIEYDVDMSTIGCNCVTSFYLVSAPGMKSDF